MAEIQEFFDQARRQWGFEGSETVSGIIKSQLLSGQMLKAPTGNLRSRIDTELLPSGFTVGTSVDYGVYLHEGIPGHTILPRKPGGFLAWQGPSGMVFARRVNMPAQPARPFISRGFEIGEPTLKSLAEELWARAIERAFPDRTVATGKA